MLTDGKLVFQKEIDHNPGQPVASPFDTATLDLIFWHDYDCMRVLCARDLGGLYWGVELPARGRREPCRREIDFCNLPSFETPSRNASHFILNQLHSLPIMHGLHHLRQHLHGQLADHPADDSSHGN